MRHPAPTDNTPTAVLSRRQRRAADWLWVAYILVVCIGLPYIMPGVPFWTGRFGLLIVPLAAMVCYRYTAGYSIKGEFVLLSASMLLGAGIIANVWYYTTLSGGTDSAPVLVNADMHRTFEDALYYLGYNEHRSSITHSLYSVIIAGVLAVTGPSVTAGLLVNMACTLATLVCVSTLWVNVTGRRSDSWIAMLCTAAVCYLLASGTFLNKDAWTICAMSVAATGLTRPSSPRMFMAVIVGAIMLFISRMNMLWALVAGIVIMWVFARAPLRHQGWTIAALALIIAMYYYGRYEPGATPQTLMVISPSENIYVSYQADNQMAYYRLFGDYHDHGQFERLLLMPVSAIVQYLIPFPWNYARDTIFGLTEAYAHFGYPWYIFGAVLVYYMCAVWRRSPVMMRALTLWAIFIWLIPCWCFGGTISRYGLMAVPLMAPAVAYTIKTSTKRKSMRIYSLIFIILLAATLIVCYHLHTVNQS